jgi:hypothetical protein
MNNTPERAEFWKEFICTKCQFPAPERLRAQFSHAELSEFCDCGCNSFKVTVREGAGVEPIATKGKYGKVFEADFKLADDEKSLEVILLADEAGNLAYVEIDCCVNSYPIPEIVRVQEPPYHVDAHKSLVA